VISHDGGRFDVILVSGEPYADHPMSPVGVIARVLDAAGYDVGVIERPDWRSAAPFAKLGRPRLFFGITSGSIDSMLVNYTPLKRERARDPHAARVSGLPDRAVIVYANRVREAFKGVPVVIGGIEASLRRFAHYDYWDDAVRRSILLDSRADILVYGPGELQVLEIARRLEEGRELDGIPGTCVVRGSLPEGAEEIPSYEAAASDREEFCRAQRLFTTSKLLAQRHAERYVVQYPAPEYGSADLDRTYGLPFARYIPEGFPELEMGLLSVQTHRGCAGRCSFCSLSLHQGERVVSRSPGSIMEEVARLTRHPAFRGYIDDLGGPTANMYGLDLAAAEKRDGKTGEEGLLRRSHGLLLDLMRRARQAAGVKKVFVRSGVRYDLALANDDYVRELARHHVSGLLKVAPEHVSPRVLRLMNKGGGRRELEAFRGLFLEGCGGRKQHLKYYFMVAHPGATMDEAAELAVFIRELQRRGERPVEGVQVFTPTPMTRSACMYHTGRDPVTGEEVYVPRTYREKKEQRQMALGRAAGPGGPRKTR
jgi:uncharacterized radical SAM protein YgiQ